MIEENKLPKGWVQTTLGDLLPIQYGKGLVVASRVLNGEIPVYGSSGIVGFHNQALTTKPSLVIGRKGSIGSVYHSTVPCWPIDTTYFTEEDSNKNLKFFLHLLSFLDLHQFDKSTAIPGLSRDDYNALVVQVAPLPEQQRIVTAIEQQFTRLDAAVTALQHAKTKLKRYRAAVLKAAVEGKLTEAWRAEHPAPEPASALLERILVERRVKWEADQRAKGKDLAKVKYVELARLDVENLPNLPEGWCWATVDQIAILVTDGDHNPPKRVFSGCPHLTAKNIIHSHIDFSDCTFITEDDAKRVFKRYKPLPNDLIVTCVGTIGRTAIVPEGVVFSPDRNLAAIRTLLDHHFVKFLEYCLLSPDIQEKMAGISGSTAQPHLYLTDLRALCFPFPPLREQRQIVSEIERRLSIVTQLEATVNANLKRAERLRQSVLNKAFAGRLVPQDSNDEPASTLLERIRKEREEQKQGPIGKRRLLKTMHSPIIPDEKPAPIDMSDMEQMGLWESIGSRE